MRLSKTSLVIAILAGLVALGPTPAWAHARLLSAVPAANSAVADSPAEIVLTFNEAVKSIAFKVVDKDGKDVAGIGAVRADGMALHVPVTGALPHGQYTATYRIAGGDGHAVNGTLTFTIGTPKP